MLVNKDIKIAFMIITLFGPAVGVIDINLDDVEGLADYVTRKVTSEPFEMLPLGAFDGTSEE